MFYSMKTKENDGTAGTAWRYLRRMEARRPLHIAVDFDGVLFNHIPYVLRAFRDAHGIDLAADGLRHWDFTQYRAVRQGGLTYECVRSVLLRIETDPLVHAEAPLDPTARLQMSEWIRQGHRVDVVTAREPVSRSVTRLFLEENRVPYHDLRMGVTPKTGYDVLVDDAPHNVIPASADGSLALLMDHPYNRDVPTSVALRRVRRWAQIGRIVRGARTASPLLAERIRRTVQTLPEEVVTS
jgi:uncharacterized HAD superfamily protein